MLNCQHCKLVHALLELVVLYITPGLLIAQVGREGLGRLICGLVTPFLVRQSDLDLEDWVASRQGR